MVSRLGAKGYVGILAASEFFSKYTVHGRFQIDLLNFGKLWNIYLESKQKSATEA